MKLCGSAFDLRQIQDVYRHLSNYTIQKEKDKETQVEELVMSVPQFEEFMRKKFPEVHAEFTW